MSILPTGKTAPTMVNPRTMVLYGQTKQGKTTLVAGLDDNLILDLEGGTAYYECEKIDIPAIMEDAGLTGYEVLRQVIQELKAFKAKTGKNKYKTITIDPVGRLEDLILPLAVKIHQSKPSGAKFKGDDVRSIPMGAGWLSLREAFFMTLASLNQCCETLIVVAHTKATAINKHGNEVHVTDIDVSGKLSKMLAANADAIGLVYREKNKTMVDFKGQELMVTGARVSHLREQLIVAAESDENFNITHHWDKLLK